MNEKLEFGRCDESEVEQNTFTARNENGEEVVCEVYFTFDSEETGKSYIVYTDNTKDEEGNIRVYASRYNPEEDNMTLLPIETDREWEIIEKIMESAKSQV